MKNLNIQTMQVLNCKIQSSTLRTFLLWKKLPWLCAQSVRLWREGSKRSKDRRESLQRISLEKNPFCFRQHTIKEASGSFDSQLTCNFFPPVFIVQISWSKGESTWLIVTDGARWANDLCVIRGARWTPSKTAARRLTGYWDWLCRERLSSESALNWNKFFLFLLRCGDRSTAKVRASKRMRFRTDRQGKDKRNFILKPVRCISSKSQVLRRALCAPNRLLSAQWAGITLLFFSVSKRSRSARANVNESPCALNGYPLNVQWTMLPNARCVSVSASSNWLPFNTDFDLPGDLPGERDGQFALSEMVTISSFEQFEENQEARWGSLVGNFQIQKLLSDTLKLELLCKKAIFF